MSELNRPEPDEEVAQPALIASLSRPQKLSAPTSEITTGDITTGNAGRGQGRHVSRTLARAAAGSPSRAPHRPVRLLEMRPAIDDRISFGGSTWRPWATYNTGRYKAHLA